MATTTTILDGFDKSISKASDLEAAERMAKLGRVPDAIALRWLAVGMPLLAHANAKGASPKGAFRVLTELCTGDAPEKSVNTWATRVQALHALVVMLAAAGACPAPAPIPAWADPVALARAKKERAEERKAAKAAAEAEAAAAEAADHAARIDAEQAGIVVASDIGALENAVSIIEAHAANLTDEQKDRLLAALGVKINADSVTEH